MPHCNIKRDTKYIHQYGKEVLVTFIEYSNDLEKRPTRVYFLDTCTNVPKVESLEEFTLHITREV